MPYAVTSLEAPGDVSPNGVSPATRLLAFSWRRSLLWLAVGVLVAALLVTLVWLAGRYEASQVQQRLDRDAVEAVVDVRAALTRNVQTLQALQALQGAAPLPAAWALEATSLMRSHREWMRLEWRDAALGTRAAVDTPFRAPVFVRMGRDNAQADVALACTHARRISGPAYAASYFLPQVDGLGLEVLDLCLPLVSAGQITGYLVATYSLSDVLAELVGKQLTRSQEVSFTEPDGTRLALHGSARRASRVFTAQHLLDLPGYTLVLRLDSWRAAPDLFPNVLTALVTAMSIALVSVLALLAKDARRRLRAEHDLAEALAFRKAMEDSLVTGLRARDLQGHTTYVNPAFCDMVGFAPAELQGKTVSAPYWPPELIDEYQKRQEVRLAGQHTPPREGFESVFMRKDGSRFPVLIIEAPLINAQGLQTGWMSAFVDISEQRRVQELQRTSQERLQATARLATVGEMASLLSHELNQPLAAIASYASGSLNLMTDPPKQVGSDHHYFELLHTALLRIAEQAQRAGKVIQSVHDMVRRREQRREAVAAQVLIDAVRPLIDLQARKLAVQVQIDVEPLLPQVLCERTMVEQVLLNLARNGLQAVSDANAANRLLRLHVGLAGDAPNGPKRLIFSVADTGLGISEDVAKQLYTPFFTTRAEGMGLGLSLCRTVIEQHGGFLGFESALPQGTIFTFTLPVATTESDH
jgi:two-component system, LuxR family, sensor histidine kinase DctS